MRFLVVRWDKQIGPVLVSDCILWILILPTDRPGYLRVGFTQQYFLPPSHSMTSYELVTAHTHSWPGSIMTSFHPFSSWKEVDSELQTSFWWPCQQSLMSPVPGYDFVAGSGQQRNEGNVNPVLPKTESNPPWHQNSSPGEYSSEWFLLLSTFSTNFLQFQHLDKSSQIPVKASGRLLDTDKMRVRALCHKNNSWGHLNGRGFRQVQERVRSCTCVHTPLVCLDTSPHCLLKMYK